MKALPRNTTNCQALCTASELLEQAQAISMFVTGAITRENPDVESGMHESEA